MNEAAPKRSFPVSTADYPFKDHWFAYHDGWVHYLDAGQGIPVLLLHGNPTWSFLYREVIKALGENCRLIAPDYPGFGYSKAPSRYGFTPSEHARVIAALIDHLGLRDFVLVVRDWGGPVGLSYAVDHPRNIRGVVVTNSWAWKPSVPQTLFSWVIGGWPLGCWLQTRRNFFARTIVPRDTQPGCSPGTSASRDTGCSSSSRASDSSQACLPRSYGRARRTGIPSPRNASVAAASSPA